MQGNQSGNCIKNAAFWVPLTSWKYWGAPADWRMASMMELWKWELWSQSQEGLGWTPLGWAEGVCSRDRKGSTGTPSPECCSHLWHPGSTGRCSHQWEWTRGQQGQLGDNHIKWDDVLLVLGVPERGNTLLVPGSQAFVLLPAPPLVSLASPALPQLLLGFLASSSICCWWAKRGSGESKPHSQSFIWTGKDKFPSSGQWDLIRTVSSNFCLEGGYPPEPADGLNFSFHVFQILGVQFWASY